MNIYSRIARYADYLPVDVCDWLNEIDAVTPDWNAMPQWAQWWAVDANGDEQWFDQQPYIVINNSIWDSVGGQHYALGSRRELPLGYDWRLSLQQRPIA